MKEVAAGLLLLLLMTDSWAVGEATESTLFTENSPLELVLEIDLKALCRVRDQAKCEDVSATLSYHTQTDGEHRIPVMVRSRGGWRLKSKNCHVPPMFILFDKGLDGTLFAGQEMLPVTTHCKKRVRYESYLLREFLAYRIYNLLTEKSVRVRLLNIVYRKPGGKGSDQPRKAFFSEHFNSMAERNGAVVRWERGNVPPPADPMELATMDLFQFMIGHVDWSTTRQHNVMLIRAQDASEEAAQEERVTAVPYDFDFSGLVSAHYAGPPPELNLLNTRHRMYRGFCNPAIDWEALFARFQDIRPAVFELIGSVPDLSKSSQKNARRFIESFYEILDSPEKRKHQIIDACR
jgi:hypothetical protein